MAQTYRTEGSSALKPSYARRSALRVIDSAEYERTQAAQHPRQRLHVNYYTHEIGVDEVMTSVAGYRVGRSERESKLLIAIGSCAGTLMFAAMVLFSLL